MYWSYIFVGLAVLTEQLSNLALADIVVGYSSSCRPLEFRWDRAGGQLVIVTVIFLLIEAFVFRVFRVLNNFALQVIGMEAKQMHRRWLMIVIIWITMHLLTDRQRQFPLSFRLFLILVIKHQCDAQYDSQLTDLLYSNTI